MPLDRSGATPGRSPCTTPSRHGPRKLLIALSGGPGQSAVVGLVVRDLAGPALRRYRLAVLDQRGTGESGALRCPNVQRLRSLDPFPPQAVAACANRIGPRRAFYTTADTVLDIDALRQAFGADKIALMGISYGTHVALQYARAFPEHVDRLVLDSIVGPDGPDAFLLDTYRNLPRVLASSAPRGVSQRDQGPGGRPGRARAADHASGPLRGDSFDAQGSAARRTTPPPTSCLPADRGRPQPVPAGALPAAIAAARPGDTRRCCACAASARAADAAEDLSSA